MTAGANQAFTNVAVALLDASDKAVLFSPYYFNHLMAVQVFHFSPRQACVSSYSWSQRSASHVSSPKCGTFSEGKASVKVRTDRPPVALTSWHSKLTPVRWLRDR